MGFQDFAKEHTTIAFLTIDRWPRLDHSIKDASVLDSLTEFTVDLLDSLGIQQTTIAAHSAGVYQQLHLAQLIPSRVKALHFIAVHIPAQFLDSKAAKLLLQVPEPIFTLVKIIDSKGLIWMNKLGLRDSTRNPSQYYQAHLGNAVIDAEMDRVSDTDTEARDIDYALTWQRLKGIDGDVLLSLFQNCTRPVTWYTSYQDVLFGPLAVDRIRVLMKKTSVDVEIVDDTNHANIYRRKDVWLNIVNGLS
jgi:pimeloyl-ACP methyl ester carboxylesterase